MEYDVLIDLNNKHEEYALGTVAKQANGSIWLKSGKTVMLATVVIDENEFAGGEFLPLTVQYVEKAYAAGKFPGGYIKRESKPSDFEALTSRVIDRSLRPLFPKGFTNPIQITIMVLSADEESDLQSLALNAASAALYISDIDIKTSVTACRVAKLEGELIINPSMSQLSESTLDLYVAGSKDDLLMIEMKAQGSVETELLSTAMIDPMIDPAMGVDTIETYSSNIVSEEEFIEILSQAQRSLNIEAAIIEKYSEKIKDAISHMAKSERSNALRLIRNEILDTHSEWDKEHVKMALVHVKTAMVRQAILEEGVRADGRALTEIRPIDIKTNVLPSAHASCLFTRGQTQALVVWRSLSDECT
jgi:polyribonucleotide nucleotidyltransferase